MILLHLGRVVEGAYGSYRLADMLFDLGGQMDIVPVGGEHGQVGAEEAELIAPGGHVNQVRQILQGVGDPAAVRQVVAALKELRAAHPQLDGEAGPHRRPDGLEHLPGEAQAVLEGAAVLVGPMVEGGGEELIHQPARQPGVFRSRWNIWEASVSGWTTSSLAVTAAAPPLARSS